MTKAKIVAAVALAAAALAGCEARQAGVAVAGLCPDWKTAAVASDPAAPVDNCAKRWAYTLAGGKDDAATVADAVVAACETALTRWNQASLAVPGPEGDALSIITGQPTNPQAEHYSFVQSRALMYVAAARAGRCSAPEVKDGVPVGVAL
jgi:hypothetical protein